uniref:Uncharacterized protein n=2 Tax=Oxyrrhis marina TaxID=2969 RepID=A0A7S3ULR2_OXYMA
MKEKYRLLMAKVDNPWVPVDALEVALRLRDPPKQARQRPASASSRSRMTSVSKQEKETVAEWVPFDGSSHSDGGSTRGSRPNSAQSDASASSDPGNPDRARVEYRAKSRDAGRPPRTARPASAGNARPSTAVRRSQRPMSARDVRSSSLKRVSPPRSEVNVLEDALTR